MVGVGGSSPLGRTRDKQFKTVFFCTNHYIKILSFVLYIIQKPLSFQKARSKLLNLNSDPLFMPTVHFIMQTKYGSDFYDLRNKFHFSFSMFLLKIDYVIYTYYINNNY